MKLRPPCRPKGTKTVVAAAVATMIAGVAGTAMAAEWEVAPEGLEAATDTVITDANWAAIKDQNAFELTASDKEARSPWASVAGDQTFDKDSLGFWRWRQGSCERFRRLR